MNIPDTAVEAAAETIDRIAPMAPTSTTFASEALTAAIPHLMPGLYVTHYPGESVIWQETPDRPDFPIHMLSRTLACAGLFDAVAALLPDRTEEDPS